MSWRIHYVSAGPHKCTGVFVNVSFFSPFASKELPLLTSLLRSILKPGGITDDLCCCPHQLFLLIPLLPYLELPSPSVSPSLGLITQTL